MPVIQGMRELLPGVKALAILRDPVERLWSTYRFMRSRMADMPSDLDFDTYVQRCRGVWERGEPLDEENRLYWTIQGGFYHPYVRSWHDSFGDDFEVVFFEQLAESPRALVVDICNWLDIDTSPAAAFTYSIENRTALHRSATLQRIALWTNRERLLGNRRRLKEPLRRAYYRLNQRRDVERMSADTRAELDAIFASGNRELFELLSGFGMHDLPSWLTNTQR